jgi:sterol desaturase/sphingolipid hydroxylase (fatty acid hydroxylase superfamily)
MIPILSFSEFLSGVWDRHVSFSSQASLQTYAGAFVTLALIFIARRRALKTSLRGFWGAIFPAKILRHKSTRVDMAHYVFNMVLMSSAYGSMIFSSEYWYRSTDAGLKALGVCGPLVSAPAPLVLLVTAAVEFLMVELGYWFGHYLMHRIPALWEFHKVHHSAEVMTPLTEWRQHPVEMVIIPNCIAALVGVGYGVLWQVFGPAQAASLFNVNIFLLVFFFTILHLRHSHVWLPFTGVLGHILQSPAHHQIHHSTNPKHFDKNLGFAMSVWDWAFGTLWIPAEREHIEFGLGEESAVFDTAHGNLMRPFVKAAGQLRAAPPPVLKAGAEKSA